MNSIEIATDTERLEIAILRTGLRKYQVAQRASLNATFLSRILNGSRVPSRVECDALADAVSVPVQRLSPDTLQIHEDAEREAASSLSESSASGDTSC